jgi:tRNA1Val (adenine37-N6)-methyltransferase
MKVSTDACIQGAWAAAEFAALQKQGAKVLDIGTGPGLLALMTAQSLANAGFDAVEINEDAYFQAVSNFEASDWGQRLKAHHMSLSDFVNLSGSIAKYDFIICNPPFFHNHLESGSKARNDARHSQSLSKKDLANAVSALLKREGVFCVMFPATEWNNCLEAIKETDLHVYKQLTVRPSATSNPNRVIGLISKEKTEAATEKGFTIYDADKKYTEEMALLLKEYYLML